jgi:ribose-phosphate pyrophosphokinase
VSISQFALFSGRSNSHFSEEVAHSLNIHLSKVLIKDFPDGEIGVHVCEEVRGKDVFVIQTLANNPHFYLMELLLLVDALKKGKPKSVTAIIPYLCYSRQNNEIENKSCGSRVIANALEVVGVDRVVSIDLHAEAIKEFYKIPFIHLKTQEVFSSVLKKQASLKDAIVVSPDEGRVSVAKLLSHLLHIGFASIKKRRFNANEVEASSLDGDVKNKSVYLVDDVVSTGQTLIKAAELCRAHGAKKVFAVVTHALIKEENKLVDCFDQLYFSNSVACNIKSDKIEIVSLASEVASLIEKL